MKTGNKRSITRLFNLSTIQQWLFISSAFSCFLLLVRIVVTNSFDYLFLPWNLFLAFIPYWVSIWINEYANMLDTRFKLIVALSIWLLFIPNSFYIITDLFHLTRFRTAPAWFDLLMIFSFAWNGILCGIVSLRRIEKLIEKLIKTEFSPLIVFAVMWLSAFGIYIGRFLRFNSWDILSNPFSLAVEILNMIIHPFQNSYAWGMTICYAIFMTLIYLTLKKLGETIVYIKLK